MKRILRFLFFLLLIPVLGLGQAKMGGGISQFTPSLNLDFTQGSMPAGLTFARNSIATRFNASGVLETVAANVPRIDYDPVTLQARGLLIEESRTNLLPYSNDYTQSSWVKTNTTIVTNAVTDLWGGNTGQKIIPNAVETQHFIAQSANITSGIVYTFSVIASSAGYNWLQIIGSANPFGTNIFANFDLQNGVVGLIGSGVASTRISPLGNNRFRCEITATSVATNTGNAFVIAPLPTNSGRVTTFLGDGASGVNVLATQLEAGAFPTSYIPTLASAVTRAADNCSTLTAGWYNSNEGTFFVETYLPLGGSWGRIIQGDNNYPTLLLGPNPAITGTANSSGQDTYITGTTSTGPVRHAMSYSSSGRSVFRQGTIGTSSAQTTALGGRMYIGSGWSANQLNTAIRKLTFTPNRRPNQYLQPLTN